ncbi:MAG: LamG domain-containing protein, partial [Candidatus Omnitrophica bacterium]|nr:LamG domain-containing protein [Candidatus Omnitrophota bacterium]
MNRFFSVVLILSLTIYSISAEPPEPPEGGAGFALDAKARPLQGIEDSPYTDFPLTIECSVLLNSKDGYNILLASHAKTSDEHWELYTEARTGNLAVYAPRYQTPIHTSSADVADGKWHRLATILQDGRVRLMVDGEKVLDTEAALRQDLKPGAGPFTVGYTNDGAAKIFCDGLIDDVRISEGASLDGEVKIIGKWSFDDPDGDRYEDASESGYDLAPFEMKKKIKRLGSEVVDINDQDEDDWMDDRWPLMDTGDFFSATITTPQIPGSRPTYKGIAVKLGEDNERSILFDTELLRMTCGWEGAFIKTFPKRLGIIDLPQVAGQILFQTDPVPGWSTDGDFTDPRDSDFGPLPDKVGHYNGLYECGDRIVFTYEIAGNEILESPWIESNAGTTAIARNLQFKSIASPLQILIA